MVGGEGDVVARVPVLCRDTESEGPRGEQVADGLEDRQPVVCRQRAAGEEIRLDVDQKERGARGVDAGAPPLGPILYRG
jgi:hypothetical protein